MHALTLFRSTQALPHEAQSVLVPSAVSQPAPPLQSANPDEQPVSTQAPVVHEAVPCGIEQPTPHPPQFVAELSWVSQPFGAFVSQLPQPASQLGTQAKVPGVPWQGFEPWGFEQVTSQPEQFVGVPSVVSHPARLVLQSANPLLQVPMLQLMVEPAMVQVAGAFGNEQLVPQLPQSVSVTMLRSQPLSGLLSQLL